MDRPNGVRRTRVPVHEHFRTGNPIRDRRQDIASMRHRNARPAEAIMRFFTPELYLRFNSDDDTVADRANEEWEAALAEYRERLSEIREEMPQEVNELASLDFHDAELLQVGETKKALGGYDSIFGTPHLVRPLLISVRSRSEVIVILYFLWDDVRKNPSSVDWPFSTDQVHWLYDEVDLVDNHDFPHFVHRMLFSDGRSLEVPFSSALVHRLPIEVQTGATRHSA
jgi:hypothetical protein